MKNHSQYMEDVIQTILREQQIPGLAVGIKPRDGVAITHYGGYASLEYRVPVKSGTVFEIASVTKLFTAQAIVLLVQQGQINLDDRLSVYLKQLPAAWNPVTIRHCLIHQSGIPSYTGVDAYWTMTRRDKSHDEILALVRELPLRFEPGERVAYDNTGFYLLGLVIEAVSDMTYGAFLQEHVFAPLQMMTTGVNDYERIIPHRAAGYTLKDGDLKNKEFYSLSNTFSAGNLVSTVPDLLRWTDSLFDDRILSDDWRQRWWTPCPSEAENEREMGFSMGMGWFIVDNPAGQFVGHNGSIRGYASAFLHLLDHDITAVVLCNGDHITEPHGIALDILRYLDLIP